MVVHDGCEGWWFLLYSDRQNWNFPDFRYWGMQVCDARTTVYSIQYLVIAVVTLGLISAFVYHGHEPPLRFAFNDAHLLRGC